MLELIKKFEEQAPEIVFEWNDNETGAKGWVVINSLRGGAAGGGTRMRKGLDKHEVTSLAKTMEIKFSCCGPQIGGAKSGIDFDPDDPRKDEVLRKWYKAVMPLLKNYYGTGGDLNVDEVHDVIPITSDYGLLHPQEGVLTGHFNPSKEEKVQSIKQLQKGVSLPVTNPEFTPDASGKYLIADMITGYGVAEAVFQYYQLKGIDYSKKGAIIQGWGNVGAAATWYLAKKGIEIRAIIDREGGFIREEGFSFEEINNLFIGRTSNKLPLTELNFETINEQVWDVEAEILVPAAASRLIKKEHLERLKNAGLELISSGANVPFADHEIFYGPIAQWADQNFTLLPDFIANSGMARTFAYLMRPGTELSDVAIFNDVSKIMKECLEEVIQVNSTEKGLLATAFEVALSKIGIE